jgi:transposase
MFYRTPDIPYAEMVKSVEDYFRTPQSLRKIASVHGISHKTLWLWVEVYKKRGKAGLRARWLNKKKLSSDIEKKVMFLKEQNPSLSINKARQLLNKEDIEISNKGVWSIWKRYGFSNRTERRKSNPLDIFVELTPELEYWIEKAKELVEKEDYKKAAKILNRIPCLPECQLLKRIPKKLLSLRRRFELLYLNFGEIPHSQFLRKINRIKISLEKKGYIYSSIIASFLELNTLGWIGKLEEKIKILNQLAK